MAIPYRDAMTTVSSLYKSVEAKRDEIRRLVKLRDFRDHPKAQAFIESKALRKMGKTGRRGAKTTAAANIAVGGLLEGKRVVYGTPTSKQLDTFWRECTNATWELVRAGHYSINKTEHTIKRGESENAIVAQTLWNADTARGTYGDIIILDEFQLMNESAWEDVIQPMLVDTNGQAIFIFTPPSLLEPGISKARDPAYASKMYRDHQYDRSGLWECFHWTSHDNPFLSAEGLALAAEGMSRDSYLREIMAEDEDLNPSQVIYRAFNETSQVIPPFDIPAEWPRYSGHDFGTANPSAMFWAHDPTTGYLFGYEEYLPGVGMSTFQNAVEFKRITAGATVLKRVGGSHQEDGWRGDFTAQGWPIQEPKILDVNVRIDRVRGMMEKNQIFVFNTCRNWLRERATYLWETDRDGRITDNIRNKSAYHLMDATAYILSDFTPERVAKVKRDKPLLRRSSW